MAFSYTENSPTVGTTEYSLPANTTTGVPTAQTDAAYVQVWLDLANLAAGDSFELRIYEKVTAAGTQRSVNRVTFDGVQADPGYVHPALHLRNGWDVTLKKLSGTDRVIGCSLRKVA